MKAIPRGIAGLRGATAGARLAIHRQMLRPHSLCATLLVFCASCSSPRDISTPAAALAAPAEADAHASAAHGNHDPRHGGVVYMKGDLHFEVVLSRSGTHRVYFSDAARAELPAATASEVSVAVSQGEAAPETLSAEVDESGESWIARGPAVKANDFTARVSFVVADEPYWIDVPYVDSDGAGAGPEGP